MGRYPRERCALASRALEASAGLDTLSREELGEGFLGAGVGHYLVRIAVLGRPARFEALRLLLEEERLHALHGTAMVFRDQTRDLHRLRPQPIVGDEVIEE